MRDKPTQAEIDAADAPPAAVLAEFEESLEKEAAEWAAALKKAMKQEKT